MSEEVPKKNGPRYRVKEKEKEFYIEAVKICKTAKEIGREIYLLSVNCRPADFKPELRAKYYAAAWEEDPKLLGWLEGRLRLVKDHNRYRIIKYC